MNLLDMGPDRAVHKMLLAMLCASDSPLNVVVLASMVNRKRPLADRILVLPKGESYREHVCRYVEARLRACPDAYVSEAPGAWALRGSFHSREAWCDASDLAATELSSTRRDRLVDLLSGVAP